MTSSVPTGTRGAPPEGRAFVVDPPGFRRQPSQERSRRMVAFIEEACERLLEADGADAISPRRLADLAGVEVGSLYQYFPNVEAVIAAVCRRRTLEFCRRHAERVAGFERMSFTDAVRVTLRGVIEHHAAMHRLAPAFYLKYGEHYFDLSRYLDEIFGTRGSTQHILQRHYEASGINAVDTEMAAFLMCRCVTSAIVETARERPEYLTRPPFEDHLVNLVLGLARPALA
ncbi:MAG TPA: TetR/AcrR family transcriptional regulator [Nevskiaceae bacterium]|nr:TetR/AcrR family transcriptional regulator [Nevskiaceae bacterium]